MFFKRRFTLRGSIKAVIFLCIDAFFWLQKKEVSLPTNPKRILVCNTASFGDVVISTIVFPALKKFYPGCEISFLSNEKTADVLKNHPLLTHIHTIDHWFAKLTEPHMKTLSKWRTLLSFILDGKRLIQELRVHRYDLSIELYPHFFLSSLPFMWAARIPVRLGRYTKGCSNLLTHMAPKAEEVYMGQSHLDLLKLLGIDSEESLPSYRVDKPSLLPKGYVVVHMGTANPLKEWENAKWVELVKSLISQGNVVVLTGKGEKEQIRCNQVREKTGCINLCNQLSWIEFSATIQRAKGLISVDSAAAHIASAVELPCVVLYAGINSMTVWKPPYARCRPLMKRVPCAPCFLTEGCDRMACIRAIEPQEVIREFFNCLDGEEK